MNRYLRIVWPLLVVAPYPAWNAVRKNDAATGIATAAHGTPDGDV